jgi:hypothetical protein
MVRQNISATRIEQGTKYRHIESSLETRLVQMGQGHHPCQYRRV